VGKRQCDVEHTGFRATESWRGECDRGLEREAERPEAYRSSFPGQAPMMSTCNS